MADYTVSERTKRGLPTERCSGVGFVFIHHVNGENIVSDRSLYGGEKKEKGQHHSVVTFQEERAY